MDHKQFVGAWDLVATERRDASGKLVGEMLPGWTGQIMYSADGRMSAQLMGPSRPAVAPAPPGSRPAISSEQKVQAYDTYTGYYGRYVIDEGAGTVTHVVRGSSSPAMAGTNQVRHFRFEEDRLILSPPARPDTGERGFVIWQRVRGE